MTALQPYPAYKDSGVEWLGDVPEHWEVWRLKSLVKILSGATPNSGRREYWNGDVLWITPEDLGRLVGRDIHRSRRRITNAGYQSCGTTLAPVGSVVISTRAPIGHLAILGHEGCTNQGCRLLVPANASVSEWVYLGLLTARGELQMLGQGTTFAELSREALGALSLPLPPLREQTAIVRFIDHADGRIRRYIRAKQRLIELLEEEKQAIIHQAVTGQIDVRTGQPYPVYKDSGVEWLGKVPEHWEVRRLRSVAAIGTGGRDTIDRQAGGPYPFFVRSQAVERINTWSFDGEAVLTAGDGVGVGKVFHYVNGRFDYHQRVYKFSDFSHILGRFFFHYFRCTLRNEVLRGTAKSTVDSLRLPMLQSFPVVLPFLPWFFPLSGGWQVMLVGYRG
ncbi:MAG: restriction endonuclease subunit S, partial [Gemmatimonadetes bacterium]|nr:restriction endonuclease subunit S [Gemmatimonadota bacterium]